MARINLLPWRETARKRRRKEFALTAAAALCAMLVAGLGLHLHVERLISTQEERNRYLRKEITQLDSQIEEIDELEKTKANLLARMGVIQRLQQSRPEVVRLFDELVNAIPEGVYLTKMDQSERVIVLEGRAQSNAQISALMRNIDASRWIGEPLLLLIEHKEKTGTGLNHFQLQFSQIHPQESEGRSG